MKQYLMVFGLAYALGIGTVFVVGHNPTSLPFCEIQSRPSERNPSDDVSGDEKFFHSLEVDPFRITSAGTESCKEAPICHGLVETVLPGFNKLELGTIMMGLINNNRKWHASPEVLDASEDVFANRSQFEGEHRLILLNDLTP